MDGDPVEGASGNSLRHKSYLPIVAFASKGLRFTPAPAFAAMALLNAFYEQGANAICSSIYGGSHLTSMGTMYLLMSLFHLGPWLGLAAKSNG